jgi:hypothetical protein
VASVSVWYCYGQSQEGYDGWIRTRQKEVGGAAHGAAHRTNESRDRSRDQGTVPNAKDLDGPSGTVAGRSFRDRC